MKIIRIAVLVLLLALPFALFAIDIATPGSARLDITSRTAFGVDLDNPYRFGLKNELTQLDLVFGLASYQKLSNRLYADDAVGFINVTLFNLDLVKVDRSFGWHPPTSADGEYMGTNRYQTGEFLAGIAKGNWLFQLNAGGNEPFASPWNKGIQFINDSFKFSWAYLDTMVDITRQKKITGVPIITRRGEENMYGDGDIGPAAGYTVNQFQFDGGPLPTHADIFGAEVGGEGMVAAMYNTDDFGINAKLGTQYAFDSDQITANKDDGDGANGLALGLDATITPSALEGLKVLASVVGTVNWGRDTNADPLWAGTRVGYNIPLGEDGDISVEPWGGIDVGTKFKDESAGGGNEKMAYELAVGMNMRWPGQGGWFKDYILNSDGRVFPGMSLGYKIFANPEVDSTKDHRLKFTLFEPRGDDGLFFKIGSEIVVDITDLTDITKQGRMLMATAYFDYELTELVGKVPGLLVPWTILYYDNYIKNKRDGRVNDFKFDFGVNLENAIANTTFGIVWNTGSLIQGFNAIPGTSLPVEAKWGYIRLLAEIRL